MRVRDEEMFILTTQLEAAAASINSIFQKDDYQDYSTSIKMSIKTAEKLIEKIKGKLK